LQERKIVRDFLQLVKETIANPIADQGWVLVPRKENKECLLQLGFKYPDIKETLLDLSVKDYCEGPCDDRDQPGELWIFGKTIENKEVYIKLKLASFGPLRIVRVVSFHFAEHTLEHPFEEGGV
jgi:hypothetical protein